MSPREEMPFDIVIVGGGPAGLATAIRLRQINPGLSVALLEKGSEIGAHILSGAVIDPIGLDKLLPSWRADERFVATKVTRDEYLVLGERHAWAMPHALLPPNLSNAESYVVSLSDMCRWLGNVAETVGVEIFPGFAASEVLYADDGAVVGVAIGDMGIGKDGQPNASYQRGVALMAKFVVLAEGVRGSLTQTVMSRFGLAKASGHQKYGIGIKELWEVAAEQSRPGFVQHCFGWPLNNRTGGGTFLYHSPNGVVSVGMVVHLDYDDPYLSPFDEFQRFKTHPRIVPIFSGARRVGYGARAVSEGGYQAVPKLSFPGGLLVGDAAGFMNVPRIKGSHNAILSGILAAEHLAEAMVGGRAHHDLKSYDSAWRGSDIGKDLWPVRNAKPLWSRFGTLAGVGIGGIDMWFNRLVGWSPLGTLKHRYADHEKLRPAENFSPKVYPKPDGVLTFDRLSSVFLSGTNHQEDQPAHLKVRDPALQFSSEHDVYGGPSQRYCPAGVYEWLSSAEGPLFQINAQNCVHCKTCDIKDPNQNIVWATPEGGGGPLYAGM